MLLLPLLTTLISTTSALAIAIPQNTGGNEPTTGGVTPLFPSDVDVFYYQGTPVTSSSTDTNTCTNGVYVSNGTLQAEYCTKLCTVGIAISQTPDNNCTFTLFSGSASCSDGPDGGEGEKVVYPIPAGDGRVCVETGVEDGCDFQFASGVWSCA